MKKITKNKITINRTVVDVVIDSFMWIMVWVGIMFVILKFLKLI